MNPIVIAVATTVIVAREFALRLLSTKEFVTLRKYLAGWRRETNPEYVKLGMSYNRCEHTITGGTMRKKQRLE